jgi:hypothetical protein
MSGLMMSSSTKKNKIHKSSFKKGSFRIKSSMHLTKQSKSKSKSKSKKKIKKHQLKKSFACALNRPKLNIKLDKIFKWYGSKRGKSSESEKSCSKNLSKSKLKIPKGKVWFTSRHWGSPVKWFPKNKINFLKIKSKGMQTQRGVAKMPSQLALQSAAHKAKVNLVEKASKQKAPRSRNFEKLAEIKNPKRCTYEFHTHRVHDRITQRDSLLTMFKTFLGKDKMKVFNQRKRSHKPKVAEFEASKFHITHHL